MDAHSRSHLEELPNELLLEILTYIPWSGARVPICLVNRRLNRIATPLLYHELSEPQYDDLRKPYGVLAYRTLSERPDLGRLVKRFDWDFMKNPTNRDFRLLSNEAANLLRDYEKKFKAKRSVSSQTHHRCHAKFSAVLTVLVQKLVSATLGPAHSNMLT